MFGDSSSSRGEAGWLPGTSPLLSGPAAALAGVREASTCSGISLSLTEAREAYRDTTVLINAAEALRLHTVRIMEAHEDEAAPTGRPVQPGTVTARWLTENATLSSGRARALVDLARAGDPDAPAGTARGGRGALPMMAAALAEGLLTREHVEIAVRALTHLPTGMVREHGEAIDALFTEHAKTLPPSDAHQMAAALVATLAPRNVEDYTDTAHERRWLRVRTDRTGMVRIDGQLDPVGGALFKTLIEHLAALAAAAATDTAAGVGLETEDGQGGGLRPHLTPEQHLADAAVDLVRYAQAGFGVQHPHAEPARASVILTPEQMTHPHHVDTPHASPASSQQPQANSAAHEAPAQAEPVPDCTAAEEADVAAATAEFPTGETATGETATGETYGADDAVDTDATDVPVPSWCRAPGPATCDATGVISTRTLQTLICDAIIDRVIIDREGKVISLTSLGRLANRAQRRALAARDGGCTWPGCSAPASRTDAHHIIYWSRGGATTLDNLCLLCQHHHTEIHREQWTIVMTNGVPWFRPPPWIEPDQRLRRNTRHRTLTQTITAAHRLAAGEPITDLLRDTGPWQIRDDSSRDSSSRDDRAA